MDFQDKIFLLILGGMVGLVSSRFTLYMKYFFDILRERRKRRQFQRELTLYNSYSKTVDDFHPISTLLKMKKNVENELQKKDVFDDKTADLVRLYLDLDSHLVKHSELFEKQLRIKSSGGSIVD